MKNILLLVLLLGVSSYLNASSVEDDTKECELEKSKHCSNLALAYETGKYKSGEKVDIDYDKAFFYFNKACRLGLPSGCLGLARMYKTGHGTEVDYFKALEFYAISCNADDEIACSGLGIMYLQGLGIKQKNYSLALKYLNKGCAGGHVTGCYNLAVVYANGIGIEKNYIKALELSKYVCGAGLVSGCSLEEQLLKIM